MNTAFIWSTYSNDGECCLESVKSAIDLGADPAAFTVFIQRGRPLRDAVMEEFEVLGVWSEVGRYTRRDTYIDAIAKLRSATLAKGELVWHIDSDVVLNTLDPAREVLEGGFSGAAAAWKGCDFSGCSQFITREAAKACMRDMLDKNSAKLPHSGMPDDVMVGLVLDAVCGRDKVLRWPSSVLGWYKFKRNWEEMAATKWIHFGQKKDAARVAAGKPVRQAIAEHMRDYREWRRKTISP